MAEKHTHSILESIKKKLNKFDQKPEGATSQLPEELDYSSVQSSTHTENESADLASNSAYQTNQNLNKEDDFLADLQLEEDVALTKKEEPKQVQPSLNQSQNDHGLDDIDWDDEVSMKPVVDKVKSNVEPKNDLENFGQNDLEGFEADVEAEEKHEEKSDDFLSEIGFKEESSDADLDIILNDQKSSEIESKLPEPPSANPISNEDLSLDDIDLEMKELELKQQSDLAELPIANEENTLNELDELEKEILRQKENQEEHREELNLELEIDNIEQKANESNEFASSDQLIIENEKSEELPNLVEDNKIDLDLEIAPDPVLTEVLVDSKSESDISFVAQKKNNDPVFIDHHDDEDDEDIDFDDLELDEEPSRDNLFIEEKNNSFASEKIEQPIFENKVLNETKPLVPAFEPNLMSVRNDDFFNREAVVIDELNDKKDRKGLVLDEVTVKQTTDSVKKLIDAKNIISGVSSFSQSPVLAELATQLLEPKLEKWLNSNLPDLVEKIVREEIKKIIPKGE